MIWRRLDRLLRHSPGFTIVVLLILAFSVGANTAVFSIINGVLLRPLAYNEPGSLFAVQEAGSRFKHPAIPVSAYDFQQWRDHTHSFEGLSLMDTVKMSLTSDREPQRLSVSRVSASFFTLLGIQPSIGRGFRREEDQPGNNGVVIISNQLWRNRFQSDPSILGRQITLDDAPYEVIGIMSADVPVLRASQVRPLGAEDDPPQAWTPFAMVNNDLHPFGDWNYSCVARLKRGVSAAEALADLNAVQASIAQSAPVAWDLHAVLIPLQEQITGKIRPGLMMLFAAVLIVLLIGCANIANLILVRASNRKRELALQTALGATTWRKLKDALVEGGLLAGLGGILGLLVAYIILRLLVSHAPFDLPRLNEVGIDWRVLAFTLFVAAFVGVLFGLLPVIGNSWASMQASLKGGMLNVLGGGSSSRARSLLIAVEVALTANCLIAAGLLLHSFSRLMHVDEGFDTVRVVTVSLNLPQVRYSERPQRADFVKHVLERIQQLPGVKSVGVSSLLPLMGEGENNILTVDGVVIPKMERPIAEFRSVNSDFFTTLGIPLRSGRIFTDADKSHDVVVISDNVATRIFPGQNPIGKTIHLGDETRPPMEIVGIVGDVRGGSLDKPAPLTIYLPYWQRFAFDMFLAVKTNMSPDGIGPSIRHEVQFVDGEMPVPPPRTMEEVVDASVAQRRFQLNLIVVFALVAILLTAVGIYSVVAYAMAQRINELGVRFALGATRGNVLWLLLRQGMTPVCLGLAAGLSGTIVLGHFIRSLLFGVTPYDPVTVAVVIVLLAAVGALACYVPAQHAARMDPLRALRYE